MKSPLINGQFDPMADDPANCRLGISAILIAKGELKQTWDNCTCPEC